MYDERMYDEDDCNLSPGAEFFPAAFERRYLKRAQRVVDDLEFNQLFVRYILNFLSDFKQLIDFRVRLIAEVFRLAELQDASQDERLKSILVRTEPGHRSILRL